MRLLWTYARERNIRHRDMLLKVLRMWRRARLVRDSSAREAVRLIARAILANSYTRDADVIYFREQGFDIEDLARRE